MSLFQFAHKVNAISPEHHSSVFYLNEQRMLVPEHEAHRFIVKRKVPGGFREFYGFIKDPNSRNPGQLLAHEISEADENLYHEFGLDKELDLTIQGKKIPLYIPQDFMEVSPPSFAGVTRTKEQIAKNAVAHRQTIYDYYKTKLIPAHVRTLSECKCTSIADLFSYLNGAKKWRVGMEEYGFVDGLFEIGGYLSVSIDTTQFDAHTCVHEAGHSVSYALIDELFEEFYEIAIDANEQPPSEYGKSECSEDFAESYGFFFGPIGDRARMKKNCPKRWAFMEKLKNMGDAAIIKNFKPSAILTKRFSKYDRVIW